MPGNNVTDEMVERARLALHNLVGSTRLDISSVEINEAVRAVLRAVLTDHVVVPKAALSYAWQMANLCFNYKQSSQFDEKARRNMDEVQTGFDRAMIAAPPPVTEG